MHIFIVFKVFIVFHNYVNQAIILKFLWVEWVADLDSFFRKVIYLINRLVVSGQFSQDCKASNRICVVIFVFIYALWDKYGLPMYYIYICGWVMFDRCNLGELIIYFCTCPAFIDIARRALSIELLLSMLCVTNDNSTKCPWFGVYARKVFHDRFGYSVYMKYV